MKRNERIVVANVKRNAAKLTHVQVTRVVTPLTCQSLVWKGPQQPFHLLLYGLVWGLVSATGRENLRKYLEHAATIKVQVPNRV